MKPTNTIKPRFLNFQKRVVLGWGIVFFVVTNCSKETIPPTTAKLKLVFTHVVDDKSLELEPEYFTNDAGNNYTVTDLKYYISAIHLHGKNVDYIRKTYHYVDIRKENTLMLLLENIPPNNYHSISFNIGLDSVQNSPHSLPNTLDNVNMVWPTMMGGGYHFLKFEGKYRFEEESYGFALHLGKNTNLIRLSLDFPSPQSLTKWNEKIVLKHNLNEWFRNPTDYNLEEEASYTMNNDEAMQIISQNGQSVFSISSN
jgi:hypothetical protein